MAGLFYDPRVHDWGTPLANALTQGLQTGMAALKFGKDMKKADLDIKAGEIELKNKENMQAAGNEIAGLAEKYAADMKGLQESRKTASTPAMPENAVAAALQQGKTPMEGAGPLPGLAGVQQAGMPPGTPQTPLPLPEIQKNRGAEAATKADIDFREKASALGGQFDKDIYLSYMKNKLPDKAKEHLDAHIKGAHALASISPEVAFSYIKKGPMGEMFEGIKVEGGKTGTYKTTMSDGSYMIIDTRTGDIRAQGKADGAGKPNLASHFQKALVTGNTEALFNFVTDKSTGLVVNQQQLGKAGERWKAGEGGEGGDGKLKVGELTAVQKIVAQKYIPLAKDNARADGVDPEQIDKIGTGNYYTYLNPTQRGSHDRVIINAEGIAKKKAPASAVDEALTNWHKTGGKTETKAAGGPRTDIDKKAKADAVAQTAAAKKPKEIDVGGKKYVKITEDAQGNRWGYKVDGSKELIKKGGQ